MKGSSRRRARRMAILGLLVVAAALIAGTAHAARQNDLNDPRNLSYGVLYKGSPTQDCWKHHKPEGMVDSHVVIPIFPKQIKRGEVTNLQVQVENSWKHEISEIRIVFNFTDNDTFIAPLTGSTDTGTPPYTNKWNGIVGNEQLQDLPEGTRPPPSSSSHKFAVDQGAIALIAHGEIYYPAGTGVVENQAKFWFTQPGRTTKGDWLDRNGTVQPLSEAKRELFLPSGAVSVPNGEWQLGVDFENGDAPQATYAINVTVVYRAAGEKEFQVEFQPRNPPNPSVVPVAIIPKYGVSDVIDIPVLGIKDGTQHIEVNVTARLWFKHQAGGTPNEDWFFRVATIPVTVGDAFVAGDVTASSGGVSKVDFYLVAGEVTGFAAAFLLVPSLLLGGTYGRASRKFLNDVLGGAKRRVMFHNLVSLGLTLVALVHVVFFLLEVRYTVMMGILWGGFGALSLLLLGLTGYYQVPLIQKYGYNWWRYLHLWCGILVVVFVAWHSVQDGPDFFFVKEQMPEWAQNFNWASKDALK